MERGPQPKPFIIDGEEYSWTPNMRIPPEPVQKVLDAWKAGQPINQFIALKAEPIKIRLIARIELTTEHVASHEQLVDLGLTREKIDIAIRHQQQAAGAPLKDNS